MEDGTRREEGHGTKARRAKVPQRSEKRPAYFLGIMGGRLALQQNENKYLNKSRRNYTSCLGMRKKKVSAMLTFPPMDYLSHTHGSVCREILVCFATDIYQASSLILSVIALQAGERSRATQNTPRT